jgi:hypothetical protein
MFAKQILITFAAAVIGVALNAPASLIKDRIVFCPLTGAGDRAC